MMAYQAVVGYVGSFHGQSDAVEGDKEEDRIIEPVPAHQGNAESSDPKRGDVTRITLN